MIGLIAAPLPCQAALTIVADGSDLDQPNWSTAGYGQTRPQPPDSP